jgi:hypothetical protein
MDESVKTYHEYSEQEITGLLMGHSVTVAGDALLRLDDGTELEVIPNQGGCACSAGDYDLTALNGVENIITRVDFDTTDTDDYGGKSYKIFVYAGDERINLLSIDGDDGNGYYGTGYEIRVRGVAGDTVAVTAPPSAGGGE